MAMQICLKIFLSRSDHQRYNIVWMSFIFGCLFPSQQKTQTPQTLATGVDLVGRRVAYHFFLIFPTLYI